MSIILDFDTQRRLATMLTFMHICKIFLIECVVGCHTHTHTQTPQPLATAKLSASGIFTVTHSQYSPMKQCLTVSCNSSENQQLK